MTALKQYVKPEILAWLLAHVVLVRFLIDYQNSDPARLSQSYEIGLGLIVAMGLAGVAFLARRPRLPRWLATLRCSGLFHAAIWVGGLLVMLGIWTTPFQIFLTPLQRELLRDYGTAAVLVAAYLALFWQEREIHVPWPYWVALSAVVIAVALVVTLAYLDRYPQLNTLDELHNWVVQWTYAR